MASNRTSWLAGVVASASQAFKATFRSITGAPKRKDGHVQVERTAATYLALLTSAAIDHLFSGARTDHVASDTLTWTLDADDLIILSPLRRLFYIFS